eukprot:GDKH01015665.1.p2 GENE.GDKH01015665.1~~GDKH01015665.1.p2  ORF type:complete len:85 (-),score=11.97 GDKH01015665.1:466-720(-)
MLPACRSSAGRLSSSLPVAVAPTAGGLLRLSVVSSATATADGWTTRAGKRVAHGSHFVCIGAVSVGLLAGGREAIEEPRGRYGA